MLDSAETGRHRQDARPDAGAIVQAARRALAAIAREHPFHLLHVVTGDHDVRPPRVLHPAFHGAFDWHSAVHGHWCVVRALRATGDAGLRDESAAVLEAHFGEAALSAEADYVAAPGREGFERPYGLAWVLQLAAELRAWDDPRAAAWSAHLGPLEALAAERLLAYARVLPYPVRSGEHAQTAFALGLALDWARDAGEAELRAAFTAEARRLFGGERAAPIHWEPSAHDFLSPALGAADLMRRVLPWEEYPEWLRRFLPSLDEAAAGPWLTPVVSPDRADGKLAHLDGLNLSRAWMLEGVAAALDESAPVHALFARAAAAHRAAGLAGAASEHYAGSHWLGTFAVYLLTGRGLA
uniref:DUF2891 domain-containing protein n=1 Tax=Eiseniibacteriota bacterium TaxID=2212470 RepID=A0A832I4D6_UNCEI